ncbi:lipopolysaccharide assembly protein LapA domain-containing protein [Tropicibacter sp. Alg240-R139]|uniref:lipopolysaccharide assembly protein LapA domain-containing protein n=1 Tax=Tropicibacter sp. Alg240-R139 TaxID=2305991 RepID=UPI0013E0BB2A|nr:lipopolysaccharide assembly protein LapA domain-containing protein [Tropicibacter sp. Alg240-R139]
MRYIRYAFLGTLGILLVSVSLANRNFVTLKLVPEDLAGLIGFNLSVSLPLFVVVLGGIAAGIIIGFVWEWLREHKHRKEATVKHREVRKLEREVTKLKDKSNEGKDEVLAILDEAS